MVGEDECRSTGHGPLVELRIDLLLRSAKASLLVPACSMVLVSSEIAIPPLAFPSFELLARERLEELLVHAYDATQRSELP